MLFSLGHMQFGRFFILMLALTVHGANAHAGAWTQGKGHGLLIGSASYYATSSYFDTDGSKRSQPRFAKYELQPYGEYGVTDWLTVSGTAYLQRVAQSGRDNYGLADPEFAARFRVYKDDHQVVSLQPLVKFASSFAENAPPRGGSKSTDVELSALYGRNLELISTRDYLDTRLGYRQRDHSLNPQFRADVALGLGVAQAVEVVPAIRAIYTPDQRTAAFTNSGDLDYDSLKLEVTGIYHLDDAQWLGISAFTHVAGVQTGDGGGITLSYARGF